MDQLLAEIIVLQTNSGDGFKADNEWETNKGSTDEMKAKRKGKSAARSASTLNMNTSLYVRRNRKTLEARAAQE